MLTRRKFLEIMTFLAGSAIIGWNPALAQAKGAGKRTFKALAEDLG